MLNIIIIRKYEIYVFEESIEKYVLKDTIDYSQLVENSTFKVEEKDEIGNLDVGETYILNDTCKTVRVT